MDAPKCKICGVKHWASEKCSLTEKSFEAALAEVAALKKRTPKFVAVVAKSADDILAHKRAIKAAQMRRYRERKRDRL